MSRNEDHPPPLVPIRPRRAVTRWEDHLPEGPGLLSVPEVDLQHPHRRVRLTHIWETEPNKFGLVREYSRKPSIIPDAPYAPSEEPGAPFPAPLKAITLPPPSLTAALGPLPNYSMFLQARWLWLNGGSTGSEASNRRLITEVYGDSQFKTEDVRPQYFNGLKAKFADYRPTPFASDDGWKTGTYSIKVPLGKHPISNPFPSTAEFPVPGFRHRSIVDVVRNTLTSDPNVRDFHLHPFRQYVQKPGTSERQRVIDDVFSSDGMMEEYERLQKSPREPGCSLERIIVALQFWSDATLLANFGSAKLWPVYMCFGNQPKRARSRPDAYACHDIAYFPSVRIDVSHSSGTRL
ncbi:hypothetical protein FRB93_003046 [Tulasnella sp. JGI-2019a]|nr:hypothetical protein FRB93_003046 [Tulasnella sp. JGI-2019a]